MTTGTGYSWLTNQHGLTIDTIVELELVDPTGMISRITQKSDPDLFFALRVSAINNTKSNTYLKARVV